MLTQDKAWLESVWPKLERAAGLHPGAAQAQPGERHAAGRRPESRRARSTADYRARHRLQRPEFSNVHWNLLGLRAFIQAAHWLGKTDERRDVAEGIRRFLRRPSARPPRATCARTPTATRYVPIFMANAGQGTAAARPMGLLPRRLSRPDLRQGRSAGGQHHGDARSHRARRHGLRHRLGRHRHLELLRLVLRPRLALAGQRAQGRADPLRLRQPRLARPASGARSSRCRGEPFRKVGDMPHNWASAEFIRLAIHLLALDRGDELHLLRRLPARMD